MEILDPIVDRINFLLKDKNMSAYQLEQSSYIPHGTMAKILNKKNKDISFKTILKLAKGFNMTLIEFLENSQIEVKNFNLD